ncbi:RAB19_1 [Blepharisma stoltei]|uniref:GTP-binding protein n=1 Tax=Blepharisma stoltei TaxID=1481888 RepID=A0AAU9JYW8_9CILI|nr:unnamed protein product [Blepharisma stoltei]
MWSDSKVRKLKYREYGIILNIWDTGGLERYKNLPPIYYKSANGIFVVFDLANRNSFFNVKQWIKDIEEFSNISLAILIGNKSDLINQREISFEEAKDFADELNIPYLEVSAKNGNNINAAFEALFNVALSNFNSHR